MSRGRRARSAGGSRQSGSASRSKQSAKALRALAVQAAGLAVRGSADVERHPAGCGMLGQPRSRPVQPRAAGALRRLGDDADEAGKDPVGVRAFDGALVAKRLDRITPLGHQAAGPV